MSGEPVMSNDQPSDIPATEEPATFSYSLPEVHDMAGINENFENVASTVTSIIEGMKAHSENTNMNITRLAEETKTNLNKIAGDMKSVLSSQTMMLMICVIIFGFILIIAKGIFDATIKIFHLG